MVPRILIVDDHDDFRKAVKEYLKTHKLGIELFEASTGEMAVTKAACIQPDIVLMDLGLPGENGFKASQQIKQDHPNCQIIILTMFEVKPLKKMAQEMKARDFIGKSEIFERLIPAINRCLENHNGKKKTKKPVCS